jgi:hypothetical protein
LAIPPEPLALPRRIAPRFPPALCKHVRPHRVPPRSSKGSAALTHSSTAAAAVVCYVPIAIASCAAVPDASGPKPAVLGPRARPWSFPRLSPRRAMQLAAGVPASARTALEALSLPPQEPKSPRAQEAQESGALFRRPARMATVRHSGERRCPGALLHLQGSSLSHRAHQPTPFFPSSFLSASPLPSSFSAASLPDVSCQRLSISRPFACAGSPLLTAKLLPAPRPIPAPPSSSASPADCAPLPVRHIIASVPARPASATWPRPTPTSLPLRPT